MASPGGVMLANLCPSCGTPAAPSDRFCANCGAPLAPATSPYPYPTYPAWGPAPRNHTALIVILGVIAVVAVVMAPAVLYLLVSGFIPPVTTQPPRMLGVVTSSSSDGSNWILTFTSVPTGITQNDTILYFISASGSTLLPGTTLYELEGSGRLGVRYIPSVTGPTYTTCAAGDRILAATGSGTSQYPAGTQATIVNRGIVLFSGTLQ